MERAQGWRDSERWWDVSLPPKWPLTRSGAETYVRGKTCQPPGTVLGHEGEQGPTLVNTVLASIPNR